MKRGIVALMVALGFASPAYAAPGDPRLVQGVLEWPAKLTVEPFVVIRADDGRWYYAEVKGVKRLESGPLAAGGRVAILGTEGARPHEITAIAVGSGDVAALALALMPQGNAPAAAPAAPVGVQSRSLPKPVAAEPSQTPRAESSPAPKAAPKAEPSKAVPSSKIEPSPKTEPQTATTPATVPALASNPAPTAATTPVAALAPAAPSASGSAPAVAPTPAPATKPPQASAAASLAPAGPPVVESPTLVPPVAGKAVDVNEAEPAGDGPRWTELRGTIKVIAGNWIVVRADKGQLVLVDLSTIRGGATSLRPGAAIALYGTPTDQKFQAMGILPPDNRPAPRPATVPPRR